MVEQAQRQSVFFTFLLSGFSSVCIHKTKKSTSPQTCPEMSIMMMMMMLSRSSYKKKTVQYVYKSTPLQQYQYVPKETVRHQESREGYIHTYIPYHLQQRNNELMKFIRAKRVNSTVLLSRVRGGGEIRWVVLRYMNPLYPG